MRVLLSDGSGLTSRQTAGLLSAAGHHVEVLSPDPICLCRFTRRVRGINPVPAYGRDPFGWLDAALAIASRRQTDLLFPTQEQVAIMALEADRLEAAGLRSAVPAFSALVQVQSKLAAFQTLARIGLPQPPSEIFHSSRALASSAGCPCYVKLPIGTASNGVHKVETPEQLRRLAARLEAAGAFGAAAGAVLVQRPVEGRLAMVQSVFANGELLACHACERVREGAAGGAAHKRSLMLPEVTEYMAALGGELGWHGALSADVILGPAGPCFIDINPRLVEPVNAHLSGVDLVGALVEIARTGRTRPQAPGRSGTGTHQLLLAVLGAAQHSGRRREILRELWQAGTDRGAYRDSTEELTPTRGDPLTLLPVLTAALATLLTPGAWNRFTTGSVGAYALTPAAWTQITQHADLRAGRDVRPYLPSREVP